MATPLGAVTLPHLRAWRLHRRLSQAGLARRARVSRSTVIAAEAGKPIWRINVARLARALGVNREALATMPPDMPPER